MMKKHGFIFIGFLLLLTACQGQDIEDVQGITDISEANWEVESFEYKNQDREPFGLGDLEDGYWIANFIFTRCPTVCNTMTPNMVILQEAVLENDIDVEFVSFTVDPSYDNPEVLTEYASTYGVSQENWTFLTGYDDEEIRELSEGSFRQEMKDDPEGNDIIHGVNFFLITDEQEIIRLYDGMNTPVDEVITDLEQIGL
ncbi:SCO family protein [Geomicrobium sediminis]|uniref:Protein SCO1/2 n=1 Tax=Geomicrobium sediminis TaxID=1347788 RepID=A0ABS2P6D8_9BACL|nr:SCO family protein [Geomicrobium sediminis]MBM7630969.1 protein SCO1/2 [Geomicrobium sediminis]